MGRVHIRHELTRPCWRSGAILATECGHCTAVRGYATVMLLQGLEAVRGLGIMRMLTTCDDDNPGSIGTIERCGGVLENTVSVTGATPKRRYWIDLR